MRGAIAGTRGASATVSHHDAPELQRDPCFLWRGVGGSAKRARFWGSAGRRVAPGFLRGWRPSVWGLLCCHEPLTSVVGCPGQAGEGGPGTRPGVAMAGPLGHQPSAQAPGPAGPGQGASGPSRPSGPTVAPRASRHPDVGGSGSLPRALGDHLAVGKNRPLWGRQGP